jgi:hypothetical protein
MALLALGLAVVTRAPALADEPEAEIKLFVVEAEIDEVRQRVQEDFAKESPKQHQIYFFDTSALGLYENAHGPVILRARHKEGKKPQSTVKFRRDKRDLELEKKLTKISSELEIQTEWIVGKEGPPGISYALDAKFEKALSELEGAGSPEIASWFSPEQKEFLEAGGVEIPWEKLRLFGRIDADVWQWNEIDERVDAQVTAEFWRLGEKKIFEFSCKTPGESLAKRVEGFVPALKTARSLPWKIHNPRPGRRWNTSATRAGPAQTEVW